MADLSYQSPAHAEVTLIPCGPWPCMNHLVSVNCLAWPQVPGRYRHSFHTGYSKSLEIISQELSWASLFFLVFLINFFFVYAITVVSISPLCLPPSSPLSFPQAIPPPLSLVMCKTDFLMVRPIPCTGAVPWAGIESPSTQSFRMNPRAFDLQTQTQSGCSPSSSAVPQPKPPSLPLHY